MSIPRIEIDPDRLLSDLRTLAGFGKRGTGVSRIAFSDADIAARNWLCGRMREAGLDAAIDGAANVLGRMTAARPAVLIGSHSDSVPDGGWLDGAMGVVYGIEIARAVIEAGLEARFPVDVVSFQDEEGAYLATFGSRSLFGAVGAEEIAAARGGGRTLLDAMRAHGIDRNPALRLAPEEYRAYVEAHIEQGPRLEAAGLVIGVVTAIVGIRRRRIEIVGEAGHAGTVPMAMRRDAGAAAIRLAAALLERIPGAAGPDSVWNIGAMSLRPGAANVIPSAAEFLLELRDTDAGRLDALEAELNEAARACARETGLAVSVAPTLDIEPSRMDPALGDHLAAAAEALETPALRMPSGAGHDAAIVSRHLPSAMLFVPSIGGRSHTTSEDTAEADIVLGCRVLAETVRRIHG